MNIKIFCRCSFFFLFGRSKDLSAPRVYIYSLQFISTTLDPYLPQSRPVVLCLVNFDITQTNVRDSNSLRGGNPSLEASIYPEVQDILCIE